MGAACLQAGVVGAWLLGGLGGTGSAGGQGGPPGADPLTRRRAARPPCSRLPALQGTVLIRSAEELENYSKSEEARIEEVIKSIAGGWWLAGAGWGWKEKNNSKQF